MLCDTSDVPYLTIYSKLYKHLQKMKSPRKRQRLIPQGGVSKRSLFKTSTKEEKMMKMMLQALQLLQL
ncbi:uncharacterized protein LOC118559015 [Tachysurus ichikawai]